MADFYDDITDVIRYGSTICVKHLDTPQRRTVVLKCQLILYRTAREEAF